MSLDSTLSSHSTDDKTFQRLQRLIHLLLIAHLISIRLVVIYYSEIWDGHGLVHECLCLYVQQLQIIIWSSILSLL